MGVAAPAVGLRDGLLHGLRATARVGVEQRRACNRTCWGLQPYVLGGCNRTCWVLGGLQPWVLGAAALGGENGSAPLTCRAARPMV